MAAPTSVLQIGGNRAYVDALGYVFTATTAAGIPADFGFVDDGDGDPTTLAISCTGPRTLVSSVQAVTPPPTPPVTPPTPTPSPTPTPTPRPTPVSLAGPGKLALNGSLSGTIASWGNVSGRLDPDGAFTGSASIGPATGTTTALGLLPIRATFAFTPVGSTTGTSPQAGGFTLTTSQDVAIKGASFLGLPVASGTCHTAAPAAVTLGSTSAGATLVKGGTASGSFTLGRLTGCSTLGSLFGTNGGRATLQLQLSPFPVQPPMPPTPTTPPMPPTL